MASTCQVASAAASGSASDDDAEADEFTLADSSAGPSSERASALASSMTRCASWGESTGTVSTWGGFPA